jgi:type IV secretory pathway TrbD component
MQQRTQIILTGLVTFIAGFVVIRWYLLTGLGLMAGSWFVVENLWVLEKGEKVNWRRVAKRVAAFVVLGLAADILLRI